MRVDSTGGAQNYTHIRALSKDSRYIPPPSFQKSWPDLVQRCIAAWGAFICSPRLSYTHGPITPGTKWLRETVTQTVFDGTIRQWAARIPRTLAPKTSVSKKKREVELEQNHNKSISDHWPSSPQLLHRCFRQRFFSNTSLTFTVFTIATPAMFIKCFSKTCQ